MDKYDASYQRGYSDGLAGKQKNPPDDDARINYMDGYEDGDFKRREDPSIGTA